MQTVGCANNRVQPSLTRCRLCTPQPLGKACFQWRDRQLSQTHALGITSTAALHSSARSIDPMGGLVNLPKKIVCRRGLGVRHSDAFIVVFV